MKPHVTIYATDDAVKVKIRKDGADVEFEFDTPGMITGCELRDILEACEVQTDYDYTEGWEDEA